MRGLLTFVAGAAVGGGAIYLATRKLGAFGPLLKDSGGELGAGAGHPEMLKALGVHVRQIRRYAFASSQDKSPIVGITHASYALILLETLEEIVGTEAIARSGYDPRKLKAFITKLQDGHAEKLRACDTYLTDLLALERSEGGVAPGFVAGAFGAPRGA